MFGNSNASYTSLTPTEVVYTGKRFSWSQLLMQAFTISIKKNAPDYDESFGVASAGGGGSANDPEPKQEVAGDFTAEFDTVHIIAAGQGALAVTLPDPSGNEAKSIYIKFKSDDPINDVVTVSGYDVDGQTDYVMTSQMESIRLYSDGSEYIIL